MLQKRHVLEFRQSMIYLEKVMTRRSNCITHSYRCQIFISFFSFNKCNKNFIGVKDERSSKKEPETRKLHTSSIKGCWGDAYLVFHLFHFHFFGVSFRDELNESHTFPVCREFPGLWWVRNVEGSNCLKSSERQKNVSPTRIGFCKSAIVRRHGVTNSNSSFRYFQLFWKKPTQGNLLWSL